MLHIATSNGFMDWQKYPKRRKSIRILQPETLDSIKWHTFPVMGGRTLDFPLHDPALQFFFVPNVLIEMPAHTNSFIVLCNGLKSDFMTCACTSPSDSELRNFRTSDSASQLVRIARSGPTRTYRHWHSALSAATSPPPSGLLHSWPWLGPATQNARQLCPTGKNNLYIMQLLLT
jgi:hypothetical protein